MRKRTLTKRITSFLLMLVLVVTGTPQTITAADFVKAPLEAPQTMPQSGKREVIYVENGGRFADGFTPRTDASYGERVALPVEGQISKPGYKFGGWYDNRLYEGNPLDSVTVLDGEVPVYAKWIPRYYTVTIPDTVQMVEEGQVSVSADCEGFFPNDAVKVSVSSQNGWELASKKGKADYYLADERKLRSGDTVAEFSQDGNVSLDYKVTTEDAKLKGASDRLTFGISFQKTYVTVTLVSGEGNVEKQVVAAGTKIRDLPSGLKDGVLFLAWCYDENLLQIAEADEEIIADTILYGKFTSLEEMKGEEYQHVINAHDKEAGFSIVLTARRKMTVDEVKAALAFTNATLPNDGDFFTVTDQNGDGTTFIISGNGGFTPGCSYKLILKDQDLCFAGHEDDEEPPTEYHFSIYKEETVNVSLNDGIVFIPITEVSGLRVNGNSITNPAVSDIVLESDGVHASIKTDGSFRYAGTETLNPGDTVGIYTGEIPDNSKDELIVSNPSVNYIQLSE